MLNDNHFKTIYEPVRSECHFCRVVEFALLFGSRFFVHLFRISLACSTISYVLPLVFGYYPLFVILQDSYEIDRTDA